VSRRTNTGASSLVIAAPFPSSADSQVPSIVSRPTYKARRNGDDLRRDPLEVRKATLASIVAKASPGIRFNEHIEGDGPTVFVHACKLGLEGIRS
jgi:hypothetical protein